MSEPTEAHLAAISAAVEMMQQFGIYDTLEAGELQISVGMPILEVAEGNDNDDDWTARTACRGHRYLVDGEPGLLSVDVTDDEEAALRGAVRGEAVDTLARLLTQLEVRSEAGPCIVMISGMRAEALWLPESGRLISLLGPDDADFVHVLRNGNRGEQTDSAEGMK